MKELLLRDSSSLAMWTLGWILGPLASSSPHTGDCRWFPITVPTSTFPNQKEGKGLSHNSLRPQRFGGDRSKNCWSGQVSTAPNKARSSLKSRKTMNGVKEERAIMRVAVAWWRTVTILPYLRAIRGRESELGYPPVLHLRISPKGASFKV